MGATGKTIFVLERLNWRWYSDDGLMRLPGRTRLRSYARRANAEKARKEMEEAVRARVNPFQCGGRSLHYITSLDAGRLNDWALDIGMTPPEKTSTMAWAEWWVKQQPTMNEIQRNKMWEVFDRLRFYEVVERPERPLVYVVVRVNWAYNDQWYVAEGEGGEPDLVFRTRKEAEDYCEASDDIVRINWDDVAAEEAEEDGGFFDMQHRWQSLEGPTPKERGRSGRIPTVARRGCSVFRGHRG
jgi:hypothetical protein